MQQAVNTYLTKLLQQVERTTNTIDQEVAHHIDTIFRERWWGLFTCYDVDGLPRTNNELEQYMRRIKSGQRRILGRKNVHAFIIRYGRFAACIDYQENVDSLLIRLRQVSQDDFLRERRSLDIALAKEQKRCRFRHRQVDFLQELEVRWASAADSTPL